MYVWMSLESSRLYAEVKFNKSLNDYGFCESLSEIINYRKEINTVHCRGNLERKFLEKFMYIVKNFD